MWRRPLVITGMVIATLGGFVGAAAAVIATLVASLAWRHALPLPGGLVVPAVLAVGYMATGSGLVWLLGGLVLELGAHRHPRTRREGQDERVLRPAVKNAGERRELSREE